MNITGQPRVSKTSQISICPFMKHKWLWINFTLDLVQVKVTTGTKQRQNQDNPPKREWWPRTIAFSLSVLTGSFLGLCLASVPVTIGSRWYLQPSQVEQVVQLLKDGTSMWAVTRRFAVSPSMEKIPRHQPSKRTGFCSFVQGGGRIEEKHWQSHTKWAPAGMLLTKLSETDSIRVVWLPW